LEITEPVVYRGGVAIAVASLALSI
jgi:hypothetical protein